MCSSEIFTSTAEITERILTENITNEPTASLPAPVNLIQVTNCHHQHLHPQEPMCLSFDLAENYLPNGFPWGDIIVDNNHHLLFATDKMLHLLSCTKTGLLMLPSR